MCFRTLTSNASHYSKKSSKDLSTLNLNKTSDQNLNYLDKVLDLQNISDLSKYFSFKTSIFKKINQVENVKNLYSTNNSPIHYNNIHGFSNDYYVTNNDNDNIKLGLILPITKKIIRHSNSINKTSHNFGDVLSKNRKQKLSPIKTFDNYQSSNYNESKRNKNKYEQKKEIENSQINTKDKKKQKAEIDLKVLLDENYPMNFDYFHPNLKSIRQSILLTNNTINKKPLNIDYDILTPKPGKLKHKKLNKISFIPISYKNSKEKNFNIENIDNEKSNFVDAFRSISNSINKCNKHWMLFINGKKSKSQNKGKISNKDLLNKYKSMHINHIGNEIGKLENGYKNVKKELGKCFANARKILEEYMIQNEKEKEKGKEEKN